jgi:hypothetical protein
MKKPNLTTTVTGKKEWPFKAPVCRSKLATIKPAAFCSKKLAFCTISEMKSAARIHVYGLLFKLLEKG